MTKPKDNLKINYHKPVARSHPSADRDGYEKLWKENGEPADIKSIVNMTYDAKFSQFFDRRGEETKLVEGAKNAAIEYIKSYSMFSRINNITEHNVNPAVLAGEVGRLADNAMCHYIKENAPKELGIQQKYEKMLQKLEAQLNEKNNTISEKDFELKNIETQLANANKKNDNQKNIIYAETAGLGVMTSLLLYVGIRYLRNRLRGRANQEPGSR